MAKNKNRKKNRRNEERNKEMDRFLLPQDIKRWIGAVAMILVAIIITLSFFELSGVAGKILMLGLSFLIGKVVFVIPLIFIIAGLVFFSSKYERLFWSEILAISISILGVSGFLGGFNQEEKLGGWLGYIISWPLLKFFGFWVSQIIFFAAFLVSGLIFWQMAKPRRRFTGITEEDISQPSLIRKILTPKFKIKEIPSATSLPGEGVAGEKISPDLRTKEIEAKPFAFAYQTPPPELLEIERGGPSAGDTRVNSTIIKKTLQNFDIPVEMSEINIGPTVTQYTLKPAEGVKLSKITGLSNDLALALASHPIRIEAPIPGRSLVGIEVPNKVRAQVRLRNLIQDQNFQKSFLSLPIILGRDVAGNPVYADLARMPHILVAGSTGAGKTIFLNNLILSLLYRNSPEILRFILIDPKRVEFPVYNELPHLLTSVIFDAQKTVNALKWLTIEMERRFDVLSASRTRDIAGYNEMAAKNKTPFLPYVVLIIDELADLMASKGKEVEAGIVRLAQMARAVGIHLVVATQRPSVEVITGLIKANITSRIAFQVASQVDSRTVLDMAGAEKLLGRGDFLYLSAETARPKRIQCSYVSEREVKKVVNWLQSKSESQELTKEERLEKEMTLNLEKVLETPEAEFEEFSGQEDPLYEEAKRVVIEARKASASLLQRRLRLGYARAARLVDLLEERGVVGPGEGAKPREVYFQNEENNEWKKV